MRNSNPVWKKFLTSSKVVIATFAATFLICQSANTYAATLAQQPLFAAKPIISQVMLNMSKDHQLYFKAYDDYSDLTADSAGPETTYLHSYDYYGYFDSKKCYYYDAGIFKPSRWVNVNNYCNDTGHANTGNEWSGNFLNWATMTRMDIVRKVLYGGMRSTAGDTATGYTNGDTAAGYTVLERAFLPNDAHSFTKYYNGEDVHGLVGVPKGTISYDSLIKEENGITLCNTTTATSGLSQNTNADPRMLVAKGNFSLWASNEKFQCRWDGGGNANKSAASGIYAYDDSPNEAANGAGSIKNYNVRVQVCSDVFALDTSAEAKSKNVDNNEGCQKYPNDHFKPIGVLQQYGATESLHFGLMTGSYANNKSGGVLRKNIGTLRNEINENTGQIITPATGGSVITTLNKLKIYGYNFSSGEYNSDDKCPWGLNDFSNGSCTNWGNPQAEIYMESLRYFAGLSKTPAFTANDSAFISGLPAPAWSDPVTSANYCAPLNVLQFNASVSSYDDNELYVGGINGKGRFGEADLSLDIDAQTNLIGANEGLNGNSFFIGDNGTGSADTGVCTAKTLQTLAATKGVCPEAPRLGASYRMAGLAYYANMYGVKEGREVVKTHGVTLQPAIPQITVQVPDDTSKKITILPACTSITSGANCSIVDFKISEQLFNVTLGATAYTGVKAVLNNKKVNMGRLYVNWEDSEQGGDYDMDMWGMVDYWVASDGTVIVQTDVIHAAASHVIGFGYIVNGTQTDGLYIDSGINGYNLYGCTSCQGGDGAFAREFKAGDSAADVLQPPLYFAAKWGGFERERLVKDGVDADGVDKMVKKVLSYPPKVLDSDRYETSTWAEPENYFYSTNPSQLVDGIKALMAKMSNDDGSGSAVATNSTRTEGERYVYQARFKGEDWSGQVLAYNMDKDGNVLTASPKWDTDNTLGFPADHLTRKIYTYNDSSSKGVEFLWGSLSADQQSVFRGDPTNDADTLNEDDAALAEEKLNWIRGHEEKTSSKFRSREVLLGDIVNSDPAYAGQQKYSWHRLPVTYDVNGAVTSDKYGATTYKSYVADKKSSDARVPMLLVGANDGMLHVLNANTGDELFSYVPRGVLEKLRHIPNHEYLSPGNHFYTMDGSMFVGDVYVGGSWKTYAVGSLGAGGKGIFVLDLTDIDKNGNGFDPEKHVILDTTSKQISELGHVLGRPIIAPMKDGKWYVIFGNGVESATGKSQLMLIDLSTKTVIAKDISGSSGGLMAPALLPNNDMIIEYAYAGDKNGKLWKFDLSDANPGKWDIAFNGAPFVVLTDKNNKAQPITAAPTLGLRFAQGAIPAATMVYLGTGQYIYNGDNVPSSVVQSFYGLADEEGASKALGSWASATDRDKLLHKKEITKEGLNAAKTRSIREVTGEGRDTTNASDKKVDWATKKGWYLDLIPPSGTAEGEMVISKPLLLYDRLIFPTLIPSDQSCKAGGRGWIMDLAAVGDRYGSAHRIMPESGMALDTPTMSLSEAIESGENIYIPISNIKGEIVVEKGKTPPKAPKGRSSWRQIK